MIVHWRTQVSLAGACLAPKFCTFDKRVFLSGWCTCEA